MAEKLTTKDIRVGNLVEGGCPLGVWIIEEEDYHAMLYDGVEFEGIPLTEEWLLKFGFYTPENREGVFIKKRLQVWGHMVYLIEEDTKRAHYIPVQIHHVHQLQNLYFAMFAEELTA